MGHVIAAVDHCCGTSSKYNPQLSIYFSVLSSLELLLQHLSDARKHYPAIYETLLQNESVMMMTFDSGQQGTLYKLQQCGSFTNMLNVSMHDVACATDLVEQELKLIHSKSPITYVQHILPHLMSCHYLKACHCIHPLPVQSTSS